MKDETGFLKSLEFEMALVTMMKHHPEFSRVEHGVRVGKTSLIADISAYDENNNLILVACKAFPA